MGQVDFPTGPMYTSKRGHHVADQDLQLANLPYYQQLDTADTRTTHAYIHMHAEASHLQRHSTAWAHSFEGRHHFLRLRCADSQH